MCLGVWTTTHPDYALILATNRDEFLSRPTAHAHFHSFGAEGGGKHEVFSGVDLQAGGTWMGVNTRGDVGLLTNIREDIDPSIASTFTSRGELIKSFLTRGKDTTKDVFVKRLIESGTKYAGFTLLLLSPIPQEGGNGSMQYIYSNTLLTNGGGGLPVKIIPPNLRDESVDAISNGREISCDAAESQPWSKVITAKKMLSDILAGNTSPTILSDKLFDILSYHPPQPLLSRDSLQRTIQVIPLQFSPDTSPYGTRLSTVVLVSRTGEVQFIEKDVWKLVGERVVKGEGEVRREVFQIR